MPPAISPSEARPVGSTTPYLDRELPLPSPNWAYRRIPLWQTVLIIALFLLRTPFEIYLLILAATLVHELGHYLGGLAAGLELDRIRVGPLELDPYHRLQWRWNRNTIMGGHAVMLPKNNSAGRARLALFVVCGPLANIVCALAVLRFVPSHDDHFTGLAKLFIAVSLFVGIANLIPFRRYGLTSDGMKLVLLLVNKGRRWSFLLGRLAAIKRGEKIPAEQVDPHLLAKSDGSSDYVGANWVAYTAAEGKGDYQKAAKYLDECLHRCSIVSPDFREELILAAARFQATTRGRNDLARHWLSSGDPNKAEINRVCTEAVVLFSEGNIQEALLRIDAGEALIAQMPRSQLRIAQENAWRRLREVFDREASARDSGATGTHPSGAQP